MTAGCADADAAVLTCACVCVSVCVCVCVLACMLACVLDVWRNRACVHV